MSPYRIRLESIRFRAKHGASASERTLPRDFLVDLDVVLPASLLPDRDDRGSVFDYDALATLVVREGTAHDYRLLETLAQRLVERVFAETVATQVKVTVVKLQPPTVHSVERVSVTLEAERPAPRG